MVSRNHVEVRPTASPGDGRVRRTRDLRDACLNKLIKLARQASSDRANGLVPAQERFPVAPRSGDYRRDEVIDLPSQLPPCLNRYGRQPGFASASARLADDCSDRCEEQACTG